MDNTHDISVRSSAENGLFIPALLPKFHNTGCSITKTADNRDVWIFEGSFELDETERKCPICGSRMRINNSFDVELRHVPVGRAFTRIRFIKHQVKCSHCKWAPTQKVPFQAAGHRITQELLVYVCDLLAYGYTLKELADSTGLNRNTVKAIDTKRLEDNYVLVLEDKKLKKPEHQARYLAIDEFQLHSGHRYATHIIDLETGHVLWISHGKKKQVVYDFIEHVGMDWMSGVEVVACDMNSDFQEAFEEKCDWIQIVYDYFHIMKNFNDKVINEIRRDEQKSLKQQGKKVEADKLKKTKFLLTAKRTTLQSNDRKAQENKELNEENTLFPKKRYVPKGGQEEKYDELIQARPIFGVCNRVKVLIQEGYQSQSEPIMAEKVTEAINLCNTSQNRHLIWFGKLLTNHFEGIIAHATYQLSSGKIEGINNKIKTLRRKAYGFPNDDYFFLKIIDISRKAYIRNPTSHRLCG